MLEQLFNDPLVTDVTFNGFDLVSSRVGEHWFQAQTPFTSNEQLADWLIDQVEAAGGRLDFSNPATSVSLNGFRIHAVLPFGVSEKPLATIRRLNVGTADFVCVDVASVVRIETLLASLRAKHNVLIAGAAGAGKTTLLRHLLSHFSEERIITIEDVAELQLASPNAVSLIARNTNVESRGGISLQRLVFEALRMSPDRIAVGEVRGAELLTMLDALNTGHGGAGATIHANSLEAVAARVAAIGLAAGLSEKAIGMQAAAAFGAVAFVSNRAGHHIESIGKFICHPDGSLQVIRVD